MLDEESDTFILDPVNESPTIVFQIEEKEILRLNKQGIFFNKEEFPQFTEDCFAKKFIEVLEKGILGVKFERN